MWCKNEKREESNDNLLQLEQQKEVKHQYSSISRHLDKEDNIQVPEYESKYLKGANI